LRYWLAGLELSPSAASVPASPVHALLVVMLAATVAYLPFAFANQAEFTGAGLWRAIRL